MQLPTFLHRTIFSIGCTTFCLCVQAQPKRPLPAAAQRSAVKVSYKIIPGINNTFGYDLYADGRLRIHQPAKPAMAGNEGFKTRAAAQKVAQLAMKKMEMGRSLPTISIQEMKKLKAI